MNAAQRGHHGPASIRIPSVSSGPGGRGGPDGVQKPKRRKHKQKPPGGATPEVRKPPARVRRASARSESRDEEADGYEVGNDAVKAGVTPGKLRQLLPPKRFRFCMYIRAGDTTTQVAGSPQKCDVLVHQAATPDPLRRPGQGFAPPPKGNVGARPASSAAKAASSQDQVGRRCPAALSPFVLPAYLH